jgi:hypothetical protein
LWLLWKCFITRPGNPKCPVSSADYLCIVCMLWDYLCFHLLLNIDRQDIDFTMGGYLCCMQHQSKSDLLQLFPNLSTFQVHSWAVVRSESSKIHPLDFKFWSSSIGFVLMVSGNPTPMVVVGRYWTRFLK